MVMGSPSRSGWAWVLLPPCLGQMGAKAEHREALWTFGRESGLNPLQTSAPRAAKSLLLQANMQSSRQYWTFRPISLLFSSNLLKGGRCSVDGDKRVTPPQLVRIQAKELL